MRPSWLSLSEGFEEMGDLVAAVDAAAQRPWRIAARSCVDRR